MSKAEYILSVVLIGVMFVAGCAITTKAEVVDNPYQTIPISDEEYELLKKIVAAESQTQELEGRKAVVEVIFNRVLSDEFPDSVKGVLSQKGQFSTWSINVKRIETIEETKED